MRSQQLLSRLIEKMRAAPQPIVAAVQASLTPPAAAAAAAEGWHAPRGAAAWLCSREHAAAGCPIRYLLDSTLLFGVQGAAAGGGLALALAADLRVASRDARFSAAFVRLGLTGTDMGTSFFLWRAAGLGLAAEMLLTGRQLSAERAYQASRGCTEHQCVLFLGGGVCWSAGAVGVLGCAAMRDASIAATRQQQHMPAVCGRQQGPRACKRTCVHWSTYRCLPLPPPPIPLGDAGEPCTRS